MGSPPDIRTVGIFRRSLSVAVDAIFGALVTGLAYLSGVLNAAPFSPPPDWFWTEWWLKHWLDNPDSFILPPLVFALATIAWTSAWEGATGRTPGDRVMRIRVIGPDGESPGPVRIALRTLGVVLNLASLGLGWLWVVVSPSRRGWHDLISGTWTVDDRKL